MHLALLCVTFSLDVVVELLWWVGSPDCPRIGHWSGYDFLLAPCYSSSEESEHIELMVNTRERRANAGSKMAELMDDTEQEDEFYKNTYGGTFFEVFSHLPCLPFSHLPHTFTYGYLLILTSDVVLFYRGYMGTSRLDTYKGHLMLSLTWSVNAERSSGI